ncbi:hypothetical protein ADIAL_0160 [Alkalibacterium sp. AK22]|nr:hypothetical protein ADIAL_0160 [Alkalibacterium sp. AK22]
MNQFLIKVKELTYRKAACSSVVSSSLSYSHPSGTADF